MRLATRPDHTVVGDLDGNRDLILARLEEARAAGADVVLFPELAVTGYPPEDLLLRPGLRARGAADARRDRRRRPRHRRARRRPPLRRRPLQRVRGLRRRRGEGDVPRSASCPNYGVFDEERYFASGRELVLLRLGEALVGVTICEDMWQPGPPATDLALAGAQLLVNVSASPFHVGKEREREEMFQQRARDTSCVRRVRATRSAARTS